MTPMDTKALDREKFGELIYRALYEHQGGRWSANETRDVWYEAADRLRAALSQPAAPSDHAGLADLLRPFASDADKWDDSVPDEYRPRCTEPGNEYAHPGSETAFTLGDLRRAREAIAALSGVGPVAVKPLEWERRDKDWYARPESGPSYLLSWFYEGWDLLIDGYYVKPYIAGVRETYTIEAGKAAAQADYERRIRSALATPPSQGDAAQPGADGWRTMDSAPKDGTRILAVIFREACEDMDGIRRKEFAEVREIFYQPYRQFGMDLPWHAGDPFDSHEGMAPEHMGEAVPIAWMPREALPASPAASQEGGTDQ